MRRTLVVLILLCGLWGALRTPAAAQGVSQQEGRILSLENAWNQAQQAKDTKALEPLLAPGMVYTDYDGSYLTKSQYLASISDAALHPQQIASTAMRVFFYGENAVVTGLYVESGTFKGKPYIRHERFTDIWVNLNDSWQCVASQSTLLAH
jgi:hypothetical protein